MRAAIIALVLLAGIPVAEARADTVAAASEPGDWYRHVQSLIDRLTGARRPDREVIAPPGDIDRKMTKTPPESGGTMPIIRPPERRP